MLFKAEVINFELIAIIFLSGLVFTIINSFISFFINLFRKNRSLEAENQKVLDQANQKDFLIQNMLISFMANRKTMALPAEITEPVFAPQKEVQLTPTEINIVRILVRRSINKESTKSKDIAEEVFTSKNTVRNHLNNIRYKAGIDTRTGLVGWAIQNKIIEVNIPGVKQ